MTTIRSRLAALLIALAAPLAAQSADSSLTTDSVFLRVQRLAANGQGDAARALVQEEFEAAPTASPRFVEALYWRAVVAPTAADAERDLKTIIVDYPLSPWAVPALMRLAQLEMTRREMDKALAHLDQVLVEHPTSSERPKASFWAARVMFEQGRVVEACRQLGDASRTAPASDVELRNQIDYWNARCAAADTSAAAVRAADSSKAAMAGAFSGAAVPPPAPVGTSTTRPATPPAAPPVPASSKRQYTVQVAAYNTKTSADALAKSLRDRGYDARVFGTLAPFRVRIGRYDKRTQADSAAQKLNAKKIASFVTEAEPQ
jgi:cell division protein FtsN